MDLAGSADRCKPKIERILAHHNALRRGLGQPEIDADELCGELAEIAPKMLALCRHGLARCSTHKRRAGKRILFEGAQGGAARHRSRHLSVRHLVEHRGGAGRDRVRRWARARSATCSASPRPTRRASGRARSPPSSRTRPASCSASAGRVRHGHRARRAAAAGSMPASCARRAKWRGIDGIALTKLDVLDQLPRAQDLRRLQARRPGARPSAGGARAAGPRPADLRDDGRLDGIRRAARAPGPSFRPNASNMCGGWRS